MYKRIIEEEKNLGFLSAFLFPFFFLCKSSAAAVLTTHLPIQ